MKHYHKQRMLVDAEYAARVKVNMDNRRKRFIESGGAKRYWQKIKVAQSKQKVIYYEENKERVAVYNKSRRERINEVRRLNYSDPLKKLKNNIRSLVTTGIKKAGYTKRSKLTQILGCSFEQFKQYFESQFTVGMNWDNIHCDHIIPISLACTETQVILLSNYRNFRPCFILENYKKSAKIDLELIEKHGLLELYTTITRT